MPLSPFKPSSALLILGIVSESSKQIVLFASDSGQQNATANAKHNITQIST